MNPFIAELDRRIAAKHLLTHPFYQAWSRGDLPLEALQDYARQYYHHVSAFPTYLSAVHANSDDQEARKLILQNLMDEEAGDPNHPELWLHFSDSLGVTRDSVRSADLWDETRNLISEFRLVCGKGSMTDGLAALYAYESQIPAVSESKIDGLKRFYGMDDAARYQYFTVHVEADVEHAGQERNMLESRLSDSTSASACASADRVLNALWAMLSGVCTRHAIAC